MNWISWPSQHLTMRYMPKRDMCDLYVPLWTAKIFMRVYLVVYSDASILKLKVPGSIISDIPFFRKEKPRWRNLSGHDNYRHLGYAGKRLCREAGPLPVAILSKPMIRQFTGVERLAFMKCMHVDEGIPIGQYCLMPVITAGYTEYTLLYLLQVSMAQHWWGITRALESHPVLWPIIRAIYGTLAPHIKQ